MHSKIYIRQAIKTIFRYPEVINRAFFFVFVPFLVSLISLLRSSETIESLRSSETIDPLVIVTLLIGLINIFYQLFLWATSFFYSQQIAQGDWSEYELDFWEIFADFGVKLRILLVRIVWYLPLLSLLFAAWWFGMFDLENVSVVVAVLLVVAIVVVTSFWENVLVNISLYIYSETGQLLRSLNPRLVAQLLKKSWFDYMVVTALAILPLVIVPLVAILLLKFAFIPIIGLLLIGFAFGLYTMYFVLFIANIQGQIWGYLREEEVS